MRSETVEITSEGCNLHGILTQTEFSKQNGVVILHPHPLFGGNMDNHVVCSLERVFLEEGISTLRFDFRGSSSSPQGYSGVGGAVTDALNAIKYLRSFTDVNAVGIVGYSFGASAALRAAIFEKLLFLVSLSASVDLVLEGGFDYEQLSGIQCPVLMFHGDSDRMIPPHDLSILSGLIKLDENNAVLLEGEGHFYQWSFPTVTRILRTFLRNLPL